MRIVRGFVFLFSCFLLAAVDTAISSADDVEGRNARIERISVHSTSIAGNPEGNPEHRTVLVTLPAEYDSAEARRFSVVYFLHGYRGTPASYDERMNFREAVEQSAAACSPFILVVPDGSSKHGGAMYSSSPTTGDFETFVTSELIAAIDRRYRTIPSASGRGLAGHSMGGYGVLRLGMKHPGIFSSLYAMSACCLSARQLTRQGAQDAESDDGNPATQRSFDLMSNLAAYAAWSPDPHNPPNFIDTGAGSGTGDTLVQARMAANAPLAMLSQYVPALESYEAIAIDVGDADMLLHDNTLMHEELARLGIVHSFEVYDGDHGNRIADRLRSHVLPFFAVNLDPHAKPE